METVKEFMLIFRMKSSASQPTSEQIATMHQEWQGFIGGIASQAKLVNVSRLGFQGMFISNHELIKDMMFAESDFAISGNLTLKAPSLEEAVEIAKKCPVLYAGGTVEVRPTLPMN